MPAAETAVSVVVASVAAVHQSRKKPERSLRNGGKCGLRLHPEAGRNKQLLNRIFGRGRSI